MELYRPQKIFELFSRGRRWMLPIGRQCRSLFFFRNGSFLLSTLHFLLLESGDLLAHRLFSGSRSSGTICASGTVPDRLFFRRLCVGGVFVCVWSILRFWKLCAEFAEMVAYCLTFVFLRMDWPREHVLYRKLFSTFIRKIWTKKSIFVQQTAKINRIAAINALTHHCKWNHSVIDILIEASVSYKSVNVMRLYSNVKLIQTVSFGVCSSFASVLFYREDTLALPTAQSSRLWSHFFSQDHL